MRPLALDLFCCSGGSTTGLERAGFDVIGVDHKPSQHWTGSGELHQADLSTADAVANVIRAFRPDFVSSSPPCQFASTATPSAARAKHPNLIPSTREGILRSGVPGWIENVEAARPHFRGWWVLLCGSMFPETYHLQRHRLFETIGWKLPQPHHNKLLCKRGSDGHAPCALCEDLAPSVRRMAVAVAGNGPPDAAQTARYKRERRDIVTVVGEGNCAPGFGGNKEKRAAWRRGRNGVREVISVAGDGSGNGGRGPRRKTLTLAGNQGEGPGQLCGQNRAGVECIRWRTALGWLDGPRDRYSLRECVPPVYAEALGQAFLAGAYGANPGVEPGGSA